MNKLPINIKLILLVGLGLVFIGAVVVIESISNSSIKRTNNENFAKMEQANRDYREKALTAQVRLNQVQEVLNSVQYARIAEKSYLQFYDPQYEQHLEEHVTRALDVLNKLDKNQFSETLTTTLQSYRQDFSRIVDLHQQIEGLNSSLAEQFKELKGLLAKSEDMVSQNRFDKQMIGEELSPAEAHFGTMVAQSFRTLDFLASMRSQYLLTDNTAYIDTLTEHFKTKMGGETASIRQAAKALKEPVYIQSAEAFKKVVYHSYDQTLATQNVFNQQKETSERLNEYGTVLTETGNLLSKAISEQLDAERNVSIEEVENAKENRSRSLADAEKTVKWILVLALGTGTLILILLATFIIRSITKPLKRSIKGFTEGAEQVAAASGQVSRSSQQLAEGSSEQAASIEEISSSLEEMSSMTKQNADNAQQANSIMKEADRVVNRANDSMTQLTASMGEISKASEETSKIIKTIDEIAFQTNLLALNAAVEAARAGAAGAGFAVVADEVRNLAMRAADAAKNTAGLIESTVKKVKEGGDLVSATNDAFAEVAASASKVGQLIGEITAASSEQAEGIAQVNNAVVEMERVVQQNAANAEESASASEEMNAQALQMKHMVIDLATLIGGRGGQDDALANLDGEATPTTKVRTGDGSKSPALGDQHNSLATPEQVIPFEEDNFKDF